MQANTRWTKSILRAATEAENVPLPWARGARRRAMIARRATQTTTKAARTA